MKKLVYNGTYLQYRFGFSTPEQLKSWIYQMKWREELDKYGFRVYVYETESFYMGDTQAIFIKANSTLSHSLSLLEI